MDRLTEYDYLAGVKTGDLKAGIDERKAFDRLAAYEDTGLEPEEIGELKRRHDIFYEVATRFTNLGTYGRLRGLLAAADKAALKGAVDHAD